MENVVTLASLWPAPVVPAAVVACPLRVSIALGGRSGGMADPQAAGLIDMVEMTEGGSICL